MAVLWIPPYLIPPRLTASLRRAVFPAFSRTLSPNAHPREFRGDSRIDFCRSAERLYATRIQERTTVCPRMKPCCHEGFPDRLYFHTYYKFNSIVLYSGPMLVPFSPRKYGPYDYLFLFNSFLKIVDPVLACPSCFVDFHKSCCCFLNLKFPLVTVSVIGHWCKPKWSLV